MRRWKHNIKMDLKWDGMVWILVHSSQKRNQWDSAVNTVIYLGILKQKRFLTSWTAISFSQTALLCGVSILN